MADQELVQQSSDERYFVRSSGRVLGPFDLAKLKSLRSRGRLSRADEFSTDRQTWEPLASLDALASPAARRRASTDDAGRQAPSLLELESAAVEPGPQAAWFYFSGGEQQGPVTLAALRSLIARGAVQPDDLVWKEGMPDWVSMDELPELTIAPRTPAGPPRSVSTRDVEERHGNPVAERTSGMAVTSLILAILGIFMFGLLCVVAVIFAGVALGDIGRSQGKLAGRGLALSGLIVGVVGTVLWLIWFLFWLGMIAALA